MEQRFYKENDYESEIRAKAHIEIERSVKLAQIFNDFKKIRYYLNTLESISSELDDYVQVIKGDKKYCEYENNEEISNIRWLKILAFIKNAEMPFTMKYLARITDTNYQTIKRHYIKKLLKEFLIRRLNKRVKEGILFESLRLD